MAGSPVEARGVDQLDISVGSNEMLETLLELLQVVDGLAEVGQVVHVLELHLVDGRDGAESESESERLHSIKLDFINYNAASCLAYLFVARFKQI